MAACRGRLSMDFFPAVCSAEKGQATGEPFFEKTPVFLPDQGFGVRLPGLVGNKRRATVLAVCQRRKGAMIDYGHDTDILVQRSVDDGRTWGQQIPLFSEEGTFCLTESDSRRPHHGYGFRRLLRSCRPRRPMI